MDKEKINIQKKWPNDFDPNTKIHKVKTDYKRKDNRQIIEDALNQAEEDSADVDFGF